MESFKRDLLAGALAGLFSGMVIGILVQTQHISVTGLTGMNAQETGFVLNLLISAAIGAVFSGMMRFKVGTMAPLLSGGILIGFIWWIIGPLSLIPFLTGKTPTWSLPEVVEVFPALIGYLIFGALMGIGFYSIVHFYLLILPERVLSGPIVEKEKKQIVILGSGFGGTYTAKGLEKHFRDRSEVDITLIGKDNFLLFTPLLAEVASGGLEAQHISAPVRAALTHTRFIRAEAVKIDPRNKEVHIQRNSSAALQAISFDILVVALGSIPNYFGMPGVEEHAFSLKSLADATKLRNHVLSMLEIADTEADQKERKKLLTFFVAGGGFAGTEIAAELFDLVHGVLRYYPNINRVEIRIVLVHAQNMILPEISERLAGHAMELLSNRGIEFQLDKRVVEMKSDRVILNDGTEIATYTPIWTAGNQPHPVLRDIPCELNPRGAVIVDENLQVNNTNNIWALGDCAQIPDPYNPGSFYPPTAQHAMREGKAVADNIAAAISNRPQEPFRFKIIGLLVGLGHRSAAADIRGLQFSGFLAWFMWRTIYLSKLPGFEKKLRVVLDWTIDLFFPRDIVLTDTPSAPISTLEIGEIKEDQNPDVMNVLLNREEEGK